MSFFPFDQYRPGQEEIIKSILKSFSDNKRIVMLEAPTGSGKSVIAYTVAKHFGSSYYLTATKILQQQLINSFSTDKNLVALKGRNSYTCNKWPEYIQKAANDEISIKQALINHLSSPEFNFNCNVGVCKMIFKKSKMPACTPEQSTIMCPYWRQNYMARAAQICVMNFDSFLYQTVYGGKWDNRDFMVIDESHNTEDKLLDFVSLTVSDRDLGVTIKKQDTPEKYVRHFADIDLVKHVEMLMAVAEASGDIKKYDRLESLHSKFGLLKEISNEGWVCDYKHMVKYHVVELKPLFVKSYANELILNKANRVLMMSATILSPNLVAESLGIESNEFVFYKMPNLFPIKNRPIYVDGCGSLNFKNKIETFPKLIVKVDEICDKYNDKRGIIHTHSFEIAKLLIDSCKNSNRFLFQKNFIDKSEMLEEHSKRKNSILVAPAMHEGLDLVDGLSRFQIICKVPYPNQQDNPQLKKRVELSWHYYLWLTALKLVQSYGRSIRHKDDWAHTYIVDSDFVKFFDMAANILPDWFVEALQLN
jgi:Rad3-related DNA helicase